MSFVDFQIKKYGTDFKSPEVISQRIRDDLKILSEGFESGFHNDYENLIRTISECLDDPDWQSAALYDAISETADTIIDLMGDNAGRVRASLCHIQQINEGAEIYEPRIKQNLQDQFNKAGGCMTYALGQFFTFEHDGTMKLNNWGEFISNRIDERQITEFAMNADNHPDISVTYDITGHRTRDLS